MCPDNLRLVKSIGIWRTKKRMLAIKVELKIFLDSVYRIRNTNPRDTISSDSAVAIMIGKKEINRFKYVEEPVIEKGENPVLMKIGIKETA